MFGYEKAEILGQSADIIFTDEDRDAGIPQKEIETATKKVGPSMNDGISTKTERDFL